MEKAKSILHVLRIKDFAVHPDETQLVFDTNLNGTSNLWAMDLPETYPYQLSFLNQDAKGIAYNPDGSILYAGFDHDGNEQSGLYKLSSKNGSFHSLNGNQTDRHFEPVPVQNAVYYSSTKDNPTFLNTYRYDCLTEKEELIFEGKDGTSMLADVSPGEKAVSIHVYYVNSHTVCMIHTAEGVTTGIVPDETLPHIVYSSRFASDDRLFVTTNYEAEFSYLALYTVSSGIFTPVLSIDKTDLTAIHADPSGTFLYLIGKKGVKDVMYEYNTATGESRQIDCPCTSISKIHCASSGALYILGSTPTRPANLYVLTKHSVPGFSEQELSYPEVVTYPSFDGLVIEGLLFKPLPEEA
ncbi:S9 family peptidase, partial [Bacillus paralicheniformis]|nr:S9 family peptidase [Bacillus paralicheniformis]